MGTDAIALLRPRDPSALEPYLDLDEDSEESDGLYAEVLEDGAVLVHTFQPFAAFAGHPLEGRAWLSQFGSKLPLVHDDARGVLFFPESCEPSGETYEAVVAEVEGAGVWVPARALSDVEQATRGGGERADLVESLASSLQFGASPEQMASAVAALQKNVLEALGLGGVEEGELDGEDDSLVVIVRRKTPIPASVEEAGFVLGDILLLPDRTALVSTVYTPHGKDLVALRLAEELAPLVAEHDDPRGVPACTTSDLGATIDAMTYDEALRALGDAVVYLDLRAAAALPAEVKAHLRALGEEGEG